MPGEDFPITVAAAAVIRRVPEMERLATIGFAGGVMFAVGGGLVAGTEFALADVPGRLSPAAT